MFFLAFSACLWVRNLPTEMTGFPKPGDGILLSSKGSYVHDIKEKMIEFTKDEKIKSKTKK